MGRNRVNWGGGEHRKELMFSIWLKEQGSFVYAVLIVIHSKTPHVVTVLWMDSEDEVTIRHY